MGSPLRITRQDRGLNALGLKHKVWVKVNAEWRRINPDTPKDVQWVLFIACMEDVFAEDTALNLRRHGWTIRYKGEVLGPVDKWNQPIAKGGPGRKKKPLPCGCRRGPYTEGGRVKRDVKYIGDGTMICKHGRWDKDGNRVPWEKK